MIRKRDVLRRFRKTVSVVAEVTSGGNCFVSVGPFYIQGGLKKRKPILFLGCPLFGPPCRCGQDYLCGSCIHNDSFIFRYGMLKGVRSGEGAHLPQKFSRDGYPDKAPNRTPYNETSYDKPHYPIMIKPP